MADVKISDLAPIDSIDGSELIEVEKAGISGSTTTQGVALFVAGLIVPSVNNLVLGIVEPIGAGGFSETDIDTSSGTVDLNLVTSAGTTGNAAFGILSFGQLTAPLTITNSNTITSGGKTTYFVFSEGSGGGSITWPEGWLIDSSVTSSDAGLLAGMQTIYQVLTMDISGVVNSIVKLFYQG